jgi:hypothetical protein
MARRRMTDEADVSKHVRRQPAPKDRVTATVTLMQLLYRRN